MLTVHPWADDRPPSAQKRRGAILRENWRDQFEKFASELIGSNIYITIDLDCLAPDYSCTNWESGRFDLDDVRWGLEMLRHHAHILGGDMCGAYSAAGLCAKETTIRFGNGSSKIEFSLGRKDSRGQSRAFEALWPALTQ